MFHGRRNQIFGGLAAQGRISSSGSVSFSSTCSRRLLGVRYHVRMEPIMKLAAAFFGKTKISIGCANDMAREFRQPPQLQARQNP